jgi:hypothetical protein
MNKFTLVVEKDETEIPAEQQILELWNNFKEKNKNNSNMNLSFEFYHKTRTETDFDGKLIVDVIEKNK